MKKNSIPQQFIDMLKVLNFGTSTTNILMLSVYGWIAVYHWN